jgi:hypothetical protein
MPLSYNLADVKQEEIQRKIQRALETEETVNFSQDWFLITCICCASRLNNPKRVHIQWAGGAGCAWRIMRGIFFSPALKVTFRQRDEWSREGFSIGLPEKRERVEAINPSILNSFVQLIFLYVRRQYQVVGETIK